MSIVTNQQYLERLIEISQLINPQHGSKDEWSWDAIKTKRAPIHQLDYDTGCYLEKIRVKLDSEQPVSQAEIGVVYKTLEQWYASRKANNTVSRVFFNVIAGILSLGLFHLGYLVAKWFNQNLPWDPSKEVFSVFQSYTTMNKVKAFLADSEDFKVEHPIIFATAVPGTERLDLSQSFSQMHSFFDPKNSRSAVEVNEIPQEALKVDDVTSEEIVENSASVSKI